MKPKASVEARLAGLLANQVAAPAESHLASAAGLGGAMSREGVSPADLGATLRQALRLLAETRPGLSLGRAAGPIAQVVAEFLKGYSLAAAERVVGRDKELEVLGKWLGVFQAAPVGVALVNLAERSVKLANPAFERMFRDLLPDRGPAWPAEAFPAGPAAWLEGHVKSALARKSHTFELQAPSPAGRTLDYLIHMAVAGGAPAGDEYLALAVLDLTERREAEREKTRLEAQLRHSQKLEAVGALAGGIAHDFNNILGAIVGYSELALAKDEFSGPAQRYLREIVSASERAKALIRQLLAFSRKNETVFHKLNLRNEILSAVMILSHIIPKMVSFETKIDGDLLPVRGDRAQIEQVLINLATNARDAMPEGGQIVIQARNRTVPPTLGDGWGQGLPSGQYVQIVFSDSGCGMTEDVRARIFEPFFTTKEAGRGTGLGLSIVHGIVKGHGGQIHCFSQPGQGATFNIYLPAGQEETTMPTQESPRPPEFLRGNETILLVDDEEALRELGLETFKSMGYQVQTAGSGEEALAIYQARGKQLDLTIIDLNMPGMGGYKCLKEILALNPQAKAVITSGYSAEGEERLALASGAAGFLAKPYRRGDILELVRKILDR